MSHNSSSNTSIIIEDSSSSDYNLVAKLRRLKIQESLLVNNINKIIQKENEGEDKVTLPAFYTSEFNNFSTKVRNNVAEINNMFHDLNAQTEEELSSQDIENMKRDVIKLDEKIRSLKNYLQAELTSVISKEEELTRQVNDIEERHSTSLLRSKPRIKPFNHIVPSPVKVLIKSPFRCKEVQELQDFMMNSPNRYGGWNEYNHNIFVKLWQKYFNSSAINNELKKDTNDIIVPGDTDTFQSFQRDVLQKVEGSTKEDILSHHKWYSQYLYLKEQQQNALNKWKKSKQSLMRTSRTQGNKIVNFTKTVTSNPHYSSRKNELNLDCCEGFLNENDTEENISSLGDMSFQDTNLAEIDIMNSEATSHTSKITNLLKKRSSSDLFKPTKQWTNRCLSSQDSLKGYNNLETIKKLRIPDWRLTLQD